jgi:Domain of unknown function (DUF4340)
MQRNGLIALIAATVLVIVAAFALTLGGRGPAPVAGAGERVLPSLASRIGDVAAITLSKGSATINLQRQPNNTWVVPEKSSYPADAGKIRQTLIGLSELTLVEAKTAKPDLYPRLEIEDPGKEGGKSALVVLKDGAGAELGKVVVGKRRYDRLGTGVDGVYVRKPGDAQSWLARGSLELAGEPKEWLDKKVVSVPQGKVKSVTIIQPDGAKVVVGREAPDGKLQVADAPADAKMKSDYTVNEPAGALDNLELTDVQAASALPFPSDGVNVAEVQTFDGLVVRAQILEKDGTNWLRLSATGTGEAAEKEAKEINDKVSPWVYAIYPYKANPLKSKLADFIEPPKSS